MFTSLIRKPPQPRGSILFHIVLAKSPDNAEREIEDKKDNPKNHFFTPFSINLSTAKAAAAMPAAKVNAPK
jgi:hypothetical protein